MTNRVVLDASGLRVSKAGVNVLSATNLQFFFHSDRVSTPIWIIGEQQITGDWNVVDTFSFGKTFDNVPYSLIMFSEARPSAGAIASRDFFSLRPMGQADFSWNYSTVIKGSTTSKAYLDVARKRDGITFSTRADGPKDPLPLRPLRKWAAIVVIDDVA